MREIQKNRTIDTQTLNLRILQASKDLEAVQTENRKIARDDKLTNEVQKRNVKDLKAILKQLTRKHK